MLVNMNEVLRPAKKNKYAVGLFNAVNLQLARGIINVAESLRSPVIMDTAEVLLPYGPLEEVSYYLLPMAKKASLVLHGGSGLTDDDFSQTIKDGISKVNIFTDINVAAVEAVKQETIKKCSYSQATER